MRLTRTLVAMLALQLGCERTSSHDTNESARAQATVPAYMQPIFHSLDSLLTGEQRDSLRRLPLDSGFRYRAWQLADAVWPLEPVWIRAPIGDSIVAHGEKSYMTSLIVLDLYQQSLRSEPLDLAGALRRVSPEYVETVLPHTISVDSVLLEKDIDGNDAVDHFVREARQPRYIDTATAGDTLASTTYRLALYLNEAPSAAQVPAWLASFDDANDGQLVRAIALSGNMPEMSTSRRASFAIWI